MRNGSVHKSLRKTDGLYPSLPFYLLVHPSTSLRPGISCDKTPGYRSSLPPGMLYGIPCNGTRDRSEKYQIRNGRWVSPQSRKFLKNFDPKSDRDARMFTGAAVIAVPIKKVIDEMKWFEKQPDRREPWTLQLQSRLLRETDDEPADSLAKAGCQWYCCVFPAGCRRIKWC
jgi:hypothetical protein